MQVADLSGVFPRFRACARPRILGGHDVWRIDGLLTRKNYRNGCMGLNSDNFSDQPFKTQSEFQNDQISLSNS